MNDGISCPICRGPTLYKSTNCRSFLNHIRICQICDNQPVIATSQGINCPVCKSPIIYESPTCQSFLNHTRVCGAGGYEERKKSIIPPSDMLPNNDNFFLSLYRSHSYGGHSLLQSGRQVNEWSDLDIYSNQQYDNDHTSFTEYDYYSDDDNLERIDNPDQPTLQPHVMFGVQMRNIVAKHAAPLGMYNEITNLMNAYIQSEHIANQPPILSNKGLQSHLEGIYKTNHLKPFHRIVSLSNGSKVTVPTFDAESMILSILSSRSLMTPNNYAMGYDIFTGKNLPNHPHNELYGEIHTGKAWPPALQHYCGDDNNFMPLALVVFGDKSHTDLHGALSLTPIIFTLTLFNRATRNRATAWRPLAYSPNLSFGKGESDSTMSVTKLQDEHICLAAAFQSLIDLHKRGGMKFNFENKIVHAKIWIHFFIGDTEGNNKWLGHYNSSNQGVAMPYRDCKCNFDNMDNPSAKCEYIKLSDMTVAQLTINGPTCKETYKMISKHPIKNALLQQDLPLSDLIHGPYRMMPPELLHTSGSGLIMYMFESLRNFMSNKNREIIDNLHVRLSALIQRQSERDFPRGSIRNGIIDGTKIQSSERKGNLFCLLCIAHTTEGMNALYKGVWFRISEDGDENIINFQQRWIHFIKMYLALEEWLHDDNLREEVDGSYILIAKVLRELKILFPRFGNGYKIPKFHGMMKMRYYIQLYGSGMNFFGGPGESHHKTFVKAPGKQTQRRVGEFAIQVADRFYENLLFTTAQTNNVINDCNNSDNKDDDDNDNDDDDDDNNYEMKLSGEYNLYIDDCEDDYSVTWRYNNEKKNNAKYQLKTDLIQLIRQELTSRNIGLPCNLQGNTILTTPTDSGSILYRAHPFYHGTSWYDWALVGFMETNRLGNEEEHLYPSKIIGYITFPNDSVSYAAVQCSIKPVAWVTLMKKFIVEFSIGVQLHISYVFVPISAIVHPLMVLPKYENKNSTSYFAVLPKRNWSRYFSYLLTHQQHRNRKRELESTIDCTS